MNIHRVGRVVGAVLLATGSTFIALPSAAAPTPTAPTARATSCPPPPSQLENNGFEAPVMTSSTYQLVDQSTVPGWSTTAADGKMELWKSGFQGVPAAEGNQFAELNANLVSTLYQDIPTTPGQTLVWALSHRGRNGVDTMNVRIGAPGGTLTTVATASDGNTAWGRHSGTYTIPTGQTVTRFAFESVSAAGGNPSIGNFLDAISFGSSACVTANKSALPAGAVDVGEVVSYQVNVTNAGGSPTTAASVSDTLPTNTTFVAGSIKIDTGKTTINVPDSAYNGATRTISVDLTGSSGASGVIEPGTSVTLRYGVTVDTAASGTTLQNTATVSETDGLGGIDTFSTNQTSTPVNTAADLSISKVATASIASGGTITYSLTVANNGPSDVGTVTVTDTLPTGVTFAAAGTGSCSAVGQIVTCTTPSLSNGSLATFTFTATGTNATANPIIAVNNASATSAVHDPDLSNNTSQTATIIDPQPPAEIVVTKTALTPAVNAGRKASVSILVSNIGQTSTGSVNVTDTIPAGFTVTNVIPSAGSCTTGASVTCSLGVLTGGQTVRIIVVGRTNAALNVGTTLTDTATATDGTLTDSGTATITIANASRLVITKDTLSTPQADEPLVYSISVSNNGPSDADNAIITDTLPAGVTVTEVPSNCTLVGVTMTCTLGTLAVGDIAGIIYSVQLPISGGTFVNIASVTSSSTNPDPSGATRSKESTLSSGANLRVSKSVNHLTAKSGDRVTYTVTATNDGPGNATGVEVRDLPSSGVTLTSSATDTGTISDDGIWTVGALAAGASVTATFQARVTGICLQTNTAFVAGDQEDPDGSNNTSIANTTLPGCATTANTGSDTFPLTTAGFGLIAIGGWCMFVARRRRTSVGPFCVR
ncbi:MAG: hypothetical protein ACOYN3_03265 [Acidimicrobiia bacterium]